MGDLKVGEGFIDAVMIRVTATGAAALGLVPTCTLTRLSTGARVGLTVAEVSDGIYKVTDMAPGADDEYLTEWAVGGGNTIYQAYKLFKVGGGVIADWENGGRLDLLLDGVISDIGVFPTANYAAIAAHVEDIRARMIVILADVTGLNGDVMRGTDGAALVGDGWDATLATILDNFTPVRIGYLDELHPAAIPNDLNWLITDAEEAHERAFLRRYPFVTTNESVANAAEVSLAAPAVVTPTFPTGATRLNSYVVAILKANNQSAAEHNIGVTLQKNVAAAGWADVRDFTANPPLTLPDVDATADSITFIEPVSVTTGQTVQFRFQVDSDDAGEVHYTQVFFFVVEYDFQ